MLLFLIFYPFSGFNGKVRMLIDDWTGNTCTCVKGSKWEKVYHKVLMTIWYLMHMPYDIIVKNLRGNIYIMMPFWWNCGLQRTFLWTYCLTALSLLFSKEVLVATHNLKKQGNKRMLKSQDEAEHNYMKLYWPMHIKVNYDQRILC